MKLPNLPFYYLKKDKLPQMRRMAKILKNNALKNFDKPPSNQAEQISKRSKDLNKSSSSDGD
jgi:hypothetical protein